MSKEVGTFHISDIKNPWWECAECKKRVEYGENHKHDDLNTYILKAGQVVHIDGFPVKLLTNTMAESGTKIFKDLEKETK